MRRGFLSAGLGGVACVCAVLAGSASALADSSTLPVYTGGMAFPAIHESSGPEDFSWRVPLEDDQELQQIDDRHAVVVYSSTDITALGITAAAAHDADGTGVPTSLVVSEGDVITLVVHHRSGNPATGNPFMYPVMSGEGWESGSSTTDVVIPPAERNWHYVEGPPRMETAPWFSLRSREHFSGRFPTRKSLLVSVLTGYCLGEPLPVVDHVRVIERPKTAKRRIRSAAVTVFVRFPAPTEVVGTVNEGEPQPGCAGLGLRLRTRIKLKRPVARLFVFDGSREPPRRVLRPLRLKRSKARQKAVSRRLR